MPEIFDYDQFVDQNYARDFWHEGRRYEDQVERLTVRKLLSGLQGEWWVDLGGGFGRLTSEYFPHFQKIVLFDYSLSLLEEARERYANAPELFCVRGDLYHLPFREGVLSGGAMVRVLHHIGAPSLLFDEVSRVLHAGAFFLFEFANARHLLERFRGLLRKHSHVPGVLTPRKMAELIRAYPFSLVKKKGVSLFRMERAKKLFPLSLLTRLDQALSSVMGTLEWTPSLFWLLQKEGISQLFPSRSFAELICCPSCKGDLREETKQFLCSPCGRAYVKKEGIVDFVGG